MKKLSKEQTGIMALNVVSDDKFLEINGVKIKRKEYKGVPYRRQKYGILDKIIEK